MSEQTIPAIEEDPNLELPEMNNLEKQILDLMIEYSPQSLYRMGVERVKDRVFIPSRENLDRIDQRLTKLLQKCGSDERGRLNEKFLRSIQAVNSFEEPHQDIALVSDVLSSHLIKEGIEPEVYKKLVDQLVTALDASLQKFEGIDFAVAIRILVQYQVIGANEILEIVEYGTKDKELLSKLEHLRQRVNAFSKRFEVQGFTEGDFDEVVEILRKNGAGLERENFFPVALKHGFDYRESAAELEEDALRWLEEELPKLKRATESLANQLHAANTVEAVNEKLRTSPNFRAKDAVATVLEIRPTIQALVSESIVGINPRYDAIVVETPPYLTPIFSTGAAQDFDSLTQKPSQRFYLTTDPKKSPVSNFADLVNLLVHEEYGHCVHSSNTATHYAAEATLAEVLPSLHAGSTSEGLAFQRELEFLDCLEKIDGKLKGGDPLGAAEQGFVTFTKQYGGFDQVLREMQFSTYKQRVVRFLRVIGDVRINSGKQSLTEFLEWAEAKTGLSQRTVYFQIFPAHEAVFPGYATCYAVVGQKIREIQKPIAQDNEKLVKFNSYACSMGYPARSIYEERLRGYAAKLEKAPTERPTPVAKVEEEEDEQEVPTPAPRVKSLRRKLVVPSVTLARSGPRKKQVSSRYSAKLIKSPTRQAPSKKAEPPPKHVGRSSSSKGKSQRFRKSRGSS